MKVYTRLLYTQKSSQSIAMDQVYIIVGCTESYLNSCHDNSELEVGLAVLKELARSS